MSFVKIYTISDLIVQIPATGDLISRCREYICLEDKSADIIISESEYKLDNWPTLSHDDAIYLESGFQFYRKLLEFNGMMLHSSAVAVDGDMGFPIGGKLRSAGGNDRGSMI